MPNLQSALRAEVSRLARKELKGEIAVLRKLVAQHRSHIAALRRQVQEFHTKLKAVSNRGIKVSMKQGEHESDPKLRFRSSGFATLRKRLDLSAKDMGVLVGVSALTIYNWEKGQAHPREKQLQSIAAVRSLGKREAAARLAVASASARRKRRPNK